MVKLPQASHTFDAYVLAKKMLLDCCSSRVVGVDFEIKNHALKISKLEPGYKALIPDLYRGKVGLDAAEAQHLMDGLDWQGAVGVTGYCMGGALSIASSVLVSEVDAVVAFYGVPPPQLATLPTPKHLFKLILENLTILLDFQTLRYEHAAKSLEEKLKGTGKPFEVHVYPGVAHAFMNTSPAGIERRKGMGMTDENEAAAELAWSRFQSWMSRYLSA
ncbi:hypothetical protein OSB04_015915 [Centaurea solstitialis]|uniref:Dienelactone hydrolase domain-containing protein n=1 Tax=Centaurea solstitialis TaxID=347529 RepID=A0AA38WGY7_9ASTR|nr:hypothetical protein OSB04_015915 [Centaurea solstitialis]